MSTLTRPRAKCVCVDLTTGEMKGDKAARRAAKEALAWIKENRAALLAVWKGVNG